MSIRSELETRLKTWADAQSPKIPIAFEGVPFTKPPGTPFLQAYLMPAVTINPTVDGIRSREVGIFQVNCWVADGKGSAEAEALARNIINLFPLVPKTGTVSIEKTPSMASPLIDDGWRVVPVTITYRQELINI